MTNSDEPQRTQRTQRHRARSVRGVSRCAAASRDVSSSSTLTCAYSYRSATRDRGAKRAVPEQTPQRRSRVRGLIDRPHKKESAVVPRMSIGAGTGAGPTADESWDGAELTTSVEFSRQEAMGPSATRRRDRSPVPRASAPVRRRAPDRRAPSRARRAREARPPADSSRSPIWARLARRSSSRFSKKQKGHHPLLGDGPRSRTLLLVSPGYITRSLPAQVGRRSEGVEPEGTTPTTPRPDALARRGGVP